MEGQIALVLIGPVLLGLTDVMRLFPALLGCAEEDLDEALTLRRLQDEIPMYQMFSSVTTLRSMGLVEVNVGRCEQGLAKVWARLADLRVGHCEKLVWD